MNIKVKSHKDLSVWKEAMLLVKNIYELTSHFPDEERFGLISQMRRAAVSIPSNIAEGSARTSKKEYANFLSVARGSCAELETQLEIAVMLGLISTEIDGLKDRLDHVSRMLTRLQRSIRGNS